MVLSWSNMTPRYAKLATASPQHARLNMATGSSHSLCLKPSEREEPTEALNMEDSLVRSESSM